MRLAGAKDLRAGSHTPQDRFGKSHLATFFKNNKKYIFKKYIYINFFLNIYKYIFKKYIYIKYIKIILPYVV